MVQNTGNCCGQCVRLVDKGAVSVPISCHRQRNRCSLPTGTENYPCFPLSPLQQLSPPLSATLPASLHLPLTNNYPHACLYTADTSAAWDLGGGGRTYISIQKLAPFTRRNGLVRLGFLEGGFAGGGAEVLNSLLRDSSSLPLSELSTSFLFGPDYHVCD